ncbi:MAG: type II toxin-antitoxin system HicB family antitoxin [Desulfovibrio sp.]
MKYIAFLKTTGDGVTVFFPDFPDLVCKGENIEDAVVLAHEAAAGFFEEQCSTGAPIPLAKEFEELISREEYAGLPAVAVEVAEEGGNFQDITLSLHKQFLKRMEKTARDIEMPVPELVQASIREFLNSIYIDDDIQTSE